MRMLITGGAGFIGSHLCEKYVNEGHSVLCLDNFMSGNLTNIKHLLDYRNFKLVRGDIRDYELLEKIMRDVEVIFHLAAQSYVDFSFIAPVDTVESNVVGTCNLLEAVRKLKDSSGFDPVIHICSSSEVYGQVKADELPITENNPLRPASPYAVSKVGEDMLAMQYWLSWKIKTIRSRMFTHTGPRRGEVFVVSAVGNDLEQG